MRGRKILEKLLDLGLAEGIFMEPGKALIHRKECVNVVHQVAPYASLIPLLNICYLDRLQQESRRFHCWICGGF